MGTANFMHTLNSNQTTYPVCWLSADRIDVHTHMGKGGHALNLTPQIVSLRTMDGSVGPRHHHGNRVMVDWSLGVGRGKTLQINILGKTTLFT